MNQLGVFAKYWLPGTVKTRLARSVGDERASQLYREFVVTLLRRLHDTADCRIVAYSPVQRQAEFAAITPEPWQLIPQSSGNLGQRMQAFFETRLIRQEDRVVLIGTDSPTLPTQFIRDAFEALRTHPVVLGPTHDGGYYLVGATGQVPPIFTGIAWSTPSVWRQTVDRLREQDLRFAELPLWYDIDELADLIQAADELARLARADPAWTSLFDAVQAAMAEAS